MHAAPGECSGRESALEVGALPGMRGEVLEDATCRILGTARGKRTLHHVRFEEGSEKP